MSSFLTLEQEHDDFKPESSVQVPCLWFVWEKSIWNQVILSKTKWIKT